MRPRQMSKRVIVLLTLIVAAMPGLSRAADPDWKWVDKEINPVARALRQHSIDVTAIHNHGLQDTPRLFYMHFWATDDAAKLAQGLKAALDQTNSRK